MELCAFQSEEKIFFTIQMWTTLTDICNSIIVIFLLSL